MKPKKKSKRKKTDENLSENIDLTKSAYEQNTEKENNNEKEQNNDEEDEEEVYDPYDMSLYANPKSQQDSSQINDNNIEESQENQENITDEKTELKPKKKSKRKKTDENLSENIDLTKSAYEQNTEKENNNEKEQNNDEEDEEEPPLLEELGINPQNIKNKIIGVITLKRIDKKFLEDSDMAGPLLIFLLFAFSSVLQYKINFGYIYGISVFGSILVFLLLNLMSKNDGILLYNTISVLGYCLIPIVLLSFIAVFLDMKNILGGVFAALAIILASLNASRFFEIGLDMHSQRWIIFYPVALFYTCFVLVTVY